MMKNLLRLILFSYIFMSCEAGQSFKQFDPITTYPYPNFDENPLFTSEMREQIRPHLMPLLHPSKAMLDSLFIYSRVVLNQNSLVAAGFEVLMTTPYTYIVVARHALVPGYLFKIYLDSEQRKKDNRPGWEWLLRRCQGAANIRKVIREEKIKNFLIPDKWLYPLPQLPLTSESKQEPVILLVTDMQLVGGKTTKAAWKSASKSELKELYSILSKGYGSAFLTANVPYTHFKKFAFVDTEHPQRHIELENVIPYINDEMRPYWYSLIK